MFIMGNFDLRRNVIISSIDFICISRDFIVTKLGSPAVKNGSPGRRTNVIFNPWLSVLGPYFSEYHNNDAAVTKHLFKDNLENVNQ